MIRYFFVALLLVFSVLLFAQTDSTGSKFTFDGDFRFRLEEDWNSRKPDGSIREDRSRLRYRLRAGVLYQHNDRTAVGARLRTGNPRKQQDPQLTLGDALNEFGTLPIALEKAYFQTGWKQFDIWMGKNTFPFKKQNELFWSDNVFPEGVHIKQRIGLHSNWIDQLRLHAGHFILNARGSSFKNDSYFQGVQMETQLFQDRVAIWPTLYRFRNIQNVPDGAETFYLDYTIISAGAYVKLNQSPLIKLEIDGYLNLGDYGSNDSIPQNLQDQKRGITLAASYGEKKSKGDWLLKLTYNYQECFAALDFMAQNDWARWDYSAFGSPDGRLTNYQGIEFVLAHKIHDKIALVMKYYIVEQLVAQGDFKENGQRIRFDVDIKI